MNKIKFFKHTLRILLAVPLSFFALKFSNFKSFGNVLMFMGIYILIGIILEYIFNKFEKKEKE